MNTLIIAAFGGATALGVALIVFGLTGRQVFRPPSEVLKRASTSSLPPRLGIAVTCGVAALVATRWLVAGAIALVAALALPSVLGGKATRQRAIDRTEAIASWTEMIRDSIVAASGLEEAIVATAPVAPPAIAPEIRMLVRRLNHQRLPDALIIFGKDLDHPSGDLVVAALVIASRMEASDLSGLLSRLSDATRGEARMRIRVEVGRTRVRTATKVIVGVVIAAVLFLAIANRSYLTAYDGVGGQIMLAVVGSIFAIGGWLLTRMAEIDLPERFTARASGPTMGVEP